MYDIGMIKRLVRKESIGKYVPKLISCLEILSLDDSKKTQDFLDAFNQHIQPFILNQETEIEINNFSILLAEAEGHTFSIMAGKYEAIKKEIEIYPPKIIELQNNLEKLEGRFHEEFENIDNVIELKKNDLEKLNNAIVEKDKVRINKFKAEFESLEKKIWGEWQEEKQFIENAHKEHIEAFQETRKNDEENSKCLKEAAERTLEYFGITKEVFETGGFLIAAKNESDQANKLRIIAIALMLIVAFSVLVSSFTVAANPKPQDFIFRFLMVFTLMIPAGYAAREASRHRTNSEMYRLAGTEMSTLDHFLSGLEDKDKAKIRKELVTKYFGHFRFVGEKGSMAGVDDLLKMLDKFNKKANNKTEMNKNDG